MYETNVLGLFHVNVIIPKINTLGKHMFLHCNQCTSVKRANNSCFLLLWLSISYDINNILFNNITKIQNVDKLLTFR